MAGSSGLRLDYVGDTEGCYWERRDTRKVSVLICLLSFGHVRSLKDLYDSAQMGKDYMQIIVSILYEYTSDIWPFCAQLDPDQERAVRHIGIIRCCGISGQVGAIY